MLTFLFTLAFQRSFKWDRYEGCNDAGGSSGQPQPIED